MPFLKSLTLILCEACNFACSYCYQKRSPHRLGSELLGAGVPFFYRLLQPQAVVRFYGGEPLLEWELLRETVERLEKQRQTDDKSLRYSLTTNGSLLDPAIIDYLDRFRFWIMLSFDGLAQSVGRRAGSLEPLLDSIRMIGERPGIDLAVNAVFTPQTVGMLADSMRYIAGLGVMKITYSFSAMECWNEPDLNLLEEQLLVLGLFAVECQRKNGRQPFMNLRKDDSPRQGLFACRAGQDRLAVAADGQVWGCFIFPDFFRGQENTREFDRFCFGPLQEFITGYPESHHRLVRHYETLVSDYFHTPDGLCATCPELLECSVCPVTAAMSGSYAVLGKIPSHFCHLRRVEKKVMGRLAQKGGW